MKNIISLFITKLYDLKFDYANLLIIAIISLGVIMLLFTKLYIDNKK